MNTITIRALEQQDLPQINQLFIETVHAINSQHYTNEQLLAWAPLDKQFTTWEQAFTDHIVYVAETNGTIVGFGDITKDGLLDHLYTHRNFQGQGIGSAILAKLEETAKELGVKELYTDASFTGKQFFAKKGFTIIRKQEKYHKGFTFVNYIMKKEL